QVLKFEPLNGAKQFRQRTGPEQQKWSIKGVRIVPYRLPELIEAIAADHVVFVVEGEKDVETLRAQGITATCNPMGAGKWREDFSPIFDGADVVSCGDNDKPGRDHIQDVARKLHARRIRILDLARFWPDIDESDDISDWFARGGGTVEQLWEIVEQAPERQATNGYDPRAQQAQGKRGKIKPLSAEAIMGMSFSPIKYVVPGIIVEGLTLLAGKPKVGKSWLLLHAAIAVARGGFTLGAIHCAEGDWLYAALEDNPRRLQSRMTKLLGLQQAPKRLQFLCEMPRLAEGGLAAIKDWIAAAECPRLVAIDTLAMIRMPNRKDQS